MLGHGTLSASTPTSVLKDRLAGARAHGHAGILPSPPTLRGGEPWPLIAPMAACSYIIHSSRQPQVDYLPPHSPPGTEHACFDIHAVNSLYRNCAFQADDSSCLDLRHLKPTCDSPFAPPVSAISTPLRRPPFHCSMRPGASRSLSPVSATLRDSIGHTCSCQQQP